MADPLSISASIAGLITLTDTVFLRLMKYVRSVKGAAKEIEDLAKEINTLGGALHSLSTLAQCFGDEDANNRAFRMYHIEACNDILASMHKKLKKFDSDSSTKRFKWPFSSTRVNELLDELSRHRQSVNLALTANSMDLLLRSLAREEDLQKTASELKASVERTKEIVSRIDRNGEHQRVLDFFLKYNPQQNYEMSLKLRQPRTGLWLLRLPNFQTWLSTPDEKLWLSGIPGAGKTILAGTIIEASLERCNDRVASAFFFCDYKAGATHSPANILGALAYQIAIQKNEAYQILDQYYRDLHPVNGLFHNYTVEGLEGVVGDMIKLFDRVLITVDGIDECGEQVEEVLEMLCTLSAEYENISMALLSRDEHNIRDRLENDFVCEKVAAHKEDISEYVTAQIEKRIRTRKLRIDDLQIKGEIMESLIEGASGMFRWVACQLDHLEQCDSDEECREALKKLPPNLNETYLRILDRIPTEKALLAQQVLNSIAFEELSILALRELVSIPRTGGLLKPSGLIRESSIQRLCSSLIRKSNDEGCFEFAHFSVREFLENKIVLQGRFSQFLISQSWYRKMMVTQCLRYLQLENFNHVPLATKEEILSMQSRHKTNPLYRYAAACWLHHAGNVWDDEEVVELAKKLFNFRKTNFFSSWAVEFITEYPAEMENFEPRIDAINRVNHKDFTPLHMACTLSLPLICSYLLGEGVGVNQDSLFGTPIQCAVGSIITFQDENVSGFEYSRLLRHYLRTDNKSTIQTIEILLGAGADPSLVSSCPGLGRTTIEIALRALRLNPNFSPFALLLSGGFTLKKSDIELFSKVTTDYSFNARSPIRHSESLEQLIIVLNSLVNFSPIHRELCSVVWNFAVALTPNFISKTDLVDREISLTLDMQKKYLIRAVEVGDVSTFEKIRKASHFNPTEISNEHGDQLLSIALDSLYRKANSYSMIGTLFKVGCSFLQPNGNGSLPIHEWLSCGPVQWDGESSAQLVVKIFIDNGVTIYSQDNIGMNILHHSCKRPLYLSAFLNHENQGNITRALRTVDKDGYTPLSRAMMGYHTRSVSLLFERCKNDPETWQSKKSILALAIRGNYEDIFKKICDSGVFSTEMENDGPKLLHYVGIRTSLSFVEHLKSICPDACNTYVEDKLPIYVYLEQSFNCPRAMLSFISEEVIEALYPKQSQEHEKRLWEFFLKSVIYSAGFDASHAVDDNDDNHYYGISYDDNDNDKHYYGISYDNDENKEIICTQIIMEIKRLGCLSSYENISQRSAIIPLLESTGKDFRELGGIKPVTTQILCDIISHTSRWSEAQTSPLVVSLLKAATMSGNNKLISLLCQKGVSVHQRVANSSALEIACQSRVCISNFRALLDHADKKRLNEINAGDKGLGLIHYLARYPGTIHKVDALLDQGADPNLRTGVYPNIPAITYCLLKHQVDSAITLLNNGADPTRTDSRGFDAYLQAAHLGATGFLIALYQIKAPIWHLDWQKRSSISFSRVREPIAFHSVNALHLAAESGNTDCLAFLIDRGIFPDVNVTATDDFTPLHLAAAKGRVGPIEFLQKQKANINARTKLGHTALHLAVFNQHSAAVEILLSIGCAIVVDNSGNCPYSYAFYIGNSSVVRCFHKLGGYKSTHDDDFDDSSDDDFFDDSSDDSSDDDFNGKHTKSLLTKRQLNPTVQLEGAIIRGDIEFYEELCQKGVQLDAYLPSCGGCSPLLLAIQHKQKNIIKRLLAHKASTLKTSCQIHIIRSPIHQILADKTLVEIIPPFLERYMSDGGNLINESANPVCTAVEHDNLLGLQILLEHLQKEICHYETTAIAVDTITPLSIISSPLHLAVSRRNLEITKYLLENGADVNILGNNLDTPLHVATSKGENNIAKVLISYGADLDCRDIRGMTPLMLACSEQNLRLAKILLGTGADRNKLSYDSESLLHAAGHPGSRPYNPELLGYLWGLGLDPHLKDINGVSAIHLAICQSILSVLILNGTYEVQRTDPFPWKLVRGVGNMSWIADKFTMFRKRIPHHIFKTIANTEPNDYWSPLCTAATRGLIKIMENLLALEAVIDFEGCPDGTALMAACYAGRLESVIFLVRRGAVLSYNGTNGFRSALDEKKTPKRILQWLLVTRFTDQAKITESHNGDLSAEPLVLRSWSGATKAELIISESLERRSTQSAKDYWIFLMKEKRKWRGKVVPIIDRRRTVRPSKLIPVETVRIHPDGYETPKGTGLSGI